MSAGRDARRLGADIARAPAQRVPGHPGPQPGDAAPTTPLADGRGAGPPARHRRRWCGPWRSSARPSSTCAIRSIPGSPSRSLWCGWPAPISTTAPAPCSSASSVWSGRWELAAGTPAIFGVAAAGVAAHSWSRGGPKTALLRLVVRRPYLREPPPSRLGRRPPATSLVPSRLPARRWGNRCCIGCRPAIRALGARPAGSWRRSEEQRRGPGRRHRPAGPRRRVIRAAVRRRAGVTPGPRHRCPGEIGRSPRRPTRCRPSPPSVRFGVGRVGAARLAGPGPPALHQARPCTGLVRPHQRLPAPGWAMPPPDLGFLCLRATPPRPPPLEGPPGRPPPAPSLRWTGLTLPVPAAR